MKFRILSFQEKNYKSVITLFVILLTVLSLYFFINSGEDVQSLLGFVISIIYALALFLIGIYINSVTAKIENRFLTMKTVYHELSLLRACWKHAQKDLLFSDYFKTSTNIISIKVFTELDKESPTMVKSDYFKYRNGFVKLIAYFDKRLSDISKGGSIKKVLRRAEIRVLNTVIIIWIRVIFYKINKIMEKIEGVYGSRLLDAIEENLTSNQHFEIIYQKLNEISDSLSNKHEVSELLQSINMQLQSLQNCIEKCDKKINELSAYRDF